MVKNFIKVAFRNLWKKKLFSIINIFGLALGLTSSLLILLWIKDESSIDAFHENGSRLYTIYEAQYYNGKAEASYSTPAVLADELKGALPEVEYAAGFTSRRSNTFRVNNVIKNQQGHYAGSDFFKIFTYPLIAGTADAALHGPAAIALSKEMATSFFGSPEKAQGKAIRFNNEKDLVVTAVFDDLPANSSQQFDYLINWQYYLNANSWAKDWKSNGPETFIVLKEGTDDRHFEKKIQHFLDRYIAEPGSAFRTDLHIQRFSAKYLHSRFANGKVSGGRIDYIYLFGAIAIFILLIACVNFMNLTTAASVKRAKEIGVRKVMGSERVTIIWQFIGEAVLFSLLGMLLSFLLLLLFLPEFNKITGKEIVLSLQSRSFWLSMLSLVIITGLVSGSYPAFYLSSFKPIKVLNGIQKFTSGALFFRKGLVVFQFVLSSSLIVSTIIISMQVNYLQNKSMGFNRENLLYIPLEGELPSKYPLFKEMMMKHASVVQITRTSEPPTGLDNGTVAVEWTGKDANDKTMFSQVSVGYDFISTMNLKLLAGRDFSTSISGDSSDYLINEEALKAIGYKDPIGKPLTFWGKKGKIIGVLRNFHFNSLHEPIHPLIIRLGEQESWGMALVKIRNGRTHEAIKSLEKNVRQLNPNFPFSYQFADEEYGKLYNSERLMKQLSNWFAVLAIIIAALGLLGLILFTTQQRSKEISIRKVLGATAASLFFLLSKEFLLLVIIGISISFPISWWYMNDWLDNYSYRIQISLSVFVLAGSVAILTTLLVLSIQAIIAVTNNPVRNLRAQ